MNISETWRLSESWRVFSLICQWTKMIMMSSEGEVILNYINMFCPKWRVTLLRSWVTSQISHRDESYGKCSHGHVLLVATRCCCCTKLHYFTLKWKLSHFGRSCPTSFSVLFLSTSSSSVRSLIRSSRFELYCSNIRSMESMMFALFPLLMPRNCKHRTQEMFH